LISRTEWMRTTEKEYFVIGVENIRNDERTYNSLECLLDEKEAFSLLQQHGVLS